MTNHWNMVLDCHRIVCLRRGPRCVTRELHSRGVHIYTYTYIHHRSFLHESVTSSSFDAAHLSTLPLPAHLPTLNGCVLASGSPASSLQLWVVLKGPPRSYFSWQLLQTFVSIKMMTSKQTPSEAPLWAQSYQKWPLNGAHVCDFSG